MKVVYTAEAFGDVAHVLSYVANQSPSHAPNVAARIDMAVKALGVFPRAARFDRGTDTYERQIPGLPLLLIYSVSDQLVEVIAVFHTARDPAAKRRRIPHLNPSKLPYARRRPGSWLLLGNGEINCLLRAGR